MRRFLLCTQGSPWALAVLARLGLPLPMRVGFADDEVGRLSCCALAWAMAAETALASCPSMGANDVPAASGTKRCALLSMNRGDLAVDADAVVVVQSNQLVQAPGASEEIASWLMPSIRQPSPKKA